MVHMDTGSLFCAEFLQVWPHLVPKTLWGKDFHHSHLADEGKETEK